jgi:DNA (cytosine-5)-methyltransferase 1
LIDRSRPPVLLLENVKHLVRHGGGETFRVILKTLDDLGYAVSYSVIDASAFVPQHRERVFIIGLRRSVYGGRSFTFPEPLQTRPKLRGILEKTVDDKYVLSAHLWRYLRDYAKKHAAAGNGFGYGLVGPSDVARTLSARYHKDGSEILIDRGPRLRPRRLTPRECARLMGFPDRFTFPVSDTQAYRQLGNAVVVPVVEHVARALIEQAQLSGRSARAS